MSLSHRALRSVGACLASAVLLAACGGSSGSGSSGKSGGGSDKTFLVGAVEPLSGPYENSGNTIVNALKAKADILNKSGGIDGRKVKIIAVDSSSDQQKAVSAAQQLLQSNKLDMFAPDVIFGQTQLPLVSNLLVIGLCAAPECGDGSKYPMTFSLNPPAAKQVPPVLAYAKQQGATKIAALGTNDGAGTAFVKNVNADAQDAGVTVTKSELFDPTSTDITGQIAALRASGAQAIATYASGKTIGTVMKAMQATGWQVPVIGSPSVFTGPVNDLVPSAVASQLICLCYRVGVRANASNVDDLIAPLVGEMKQFGPITGMQAGGLAADTLQLAAYGYKKAGKGADVKKVAAAIANIGADANYPASEFLAYRDVNPNFSGDVHSPKNANLGNGFFAATKVSPLLDGTYQGVPFKY
ncbi:MAG: hypothetical protein NVSMB4_00370 [Acidimicrobiales bacterium]